MRVTGADYILLILKEIYGAYITNKIASLFAYIIALKTLMKATMNVENVVGINTYAMPVNYTIAILSIARFNPNALIDILVIEDRKRYGLTIHLH